MSVAARKIVRDRDLLAQRIGSLARPLVFTNGCFDILHRGHVAYLERAASLGSSLVVGVNSDDSVQLQGKGADRPINPLEDRAAVLAALACVDLVVPFDDETPLELILAIRPEHLVKGGDWPLASIVGAEQVRSWGGAVHSIAFDHPHSTTELIERIRGLGPRR